MTGLLRHDRVRPPALCAGDTVGIIAPASGFRRDEFQAGCAALAAYRLSYLPSIFERDGYFAGPVERRVNEIHEMFARREVRAVLCARGGYGCNHLLPHLDLDLIRANPKIFVGCSDITTLLTYLCDAAGIVTFHGPMVAGDFARPGGLNGNSWQDAVSNPGSEVIVNTEGVLPLVAGTAEGVLYGGCLSLLCASLGTRYEVVTEGTILFMEDRAERPYRIDRMLMQLKLAGKFDRVAGIIFGEMIDCDAPGPGGLSLQQVIQRILGDLGVPICFGLKSGHVSGGALTLPFGVRAKLSVEATVSLRCAPAVYRTSIPSRAT